MAKPSRIIDKRIRADLGFTGRLRESAIKRMRNGIEDMTLSDRELTRMMMNATPEIDLVFQKLETLPRKKDE